MEKRMIALGDTHGREYWDLISKTEQYDMLIFIGDYFDTHDDITPAQQMYNFKNIIELKKSQPEKIILLIGNHDFHYFPEIGDNGTSGYQLRASAAIGQLLDENRGYLQMAYQSGEFLFTHAGVGETWLENWQYEEKEGQTIADFVNDMWRYKPHSFDFYGRDGYGDSMTQTPIWIRPRSLIKDTYDNLRKKVIQVVGHTSVKRMDIQGNATGGRYYFIDTLGTSGEYLIIKGDKVSSKSITK